MECNPPLLPQGYRQRFQVQFNLLTLYALRQPIAEESVTGVVSAEMSGACRPITAGLTDRLAAVVVLVLWYIVMAGWRVLAYTLFLPLLVVAARAAALFANHSFPFFLLRQVVKVKLMVFPPRHK